MKDINGKRVCRGDIVAIKFVGGRWDRTSDRAFPADARWISDKKLSVYFGTVGDIKSVGQKCAVKVEYTDPEFTSDDNPVEIWVGPNDLMLICNSRKIKKILNFEVQ